MRRASWAALLVALLLTSCGRKSEPRRVVIVPDEEASDARDEAPRRVIQATRADVRTGAARARKDLDALAEELAAPTAQEKYDAALLRALRLLAERKHAEALKALEDARAAQDTRQVQDEI